MDSAYAPSFQPARTRHLRKSNKGYSLTAIGGIFCIFNSAAKRPQTNVDGVNFRELWAIAGYSPMLQYNVKLRRFPAFSRIAQSPQKLDISVNFTELWTRPRSPHPRASQRGGIDRRCRAAQGVAVGDAGSGGVAAFHDHAGPAAHRRDDGGVHARVAGPAMRAAAGQDEAAFAHGQAQLGPRAALARQADIELLADARFGPEAIR